ncbi:MAG: heat shock protein HspQ [Gammaproteobacteria bacterium]|nr:MAG: heat shock protein HspQ [Gammaproteobacteria bacterium]
MKPTTGEAKFAVGQVIHHRLFDYRGVIVDVDPEFQGTEEWYAQVALTRPPRDIPWYHVLVHDLSRETYVAERNLEADFSGEPVEHPYVDRVFAAFKDGTYVSHRSTN